MVDRIVQFLNIKPNQLQCSKTYFKTDRFGQGYQLEYVKQKCDVSKELPKFIKTFKRICSERGMKCTDNTLIKKDGTDEYYIHVDGDKELTYYYETVNDFVHEHKVVFYSSKNHS